MRLFNSEQIKQATGDVFGRIYEYFLAKFSIQKAHDNGEFFTPSSIVQTIVNVIEPNHGIVFRPSLRIGRHVRAVQPLHRARGRRHGEEGRLLRPGEEPRHHSHRQDEPSRCTASKGSLPKPSPTTRTEYSLTGRCDFVMATPPFNVDRGRRAYQGRPTPAFRPTGREQAKEGRKRQLSLDFLLLELSEPKWSRRLRDVLAGVERWGMARRRCARRSSRQAMWTS